MVSKLTSLPELLNLQFIESNYQTDQQLAAIREMIKEKDPNIYAKTYAMNRY